MFFTLNCSTLSTHLRPISIGQTNSTSDSLSTKINWSKITEDDRRNFRHLLQHNLPSFSSSAHSCIDPQCSTHKDIIDHFCNQLLVAIDLAAHACFPKILPRKARRVPGWNDKAKSLRQKAILWDRIWKECGCLSSGVLSTIKKNTKSRYKYEVRRLKRQADHIKSEKLAGAWCNSRTNDFWNLVRQNCSNSKFSGCNVIDGLTTDDDISSMFSSKISSLLNSDLDQSARNSFLADLTDSISNSDLLTSEISSTVVLNALDQLKKGKSDGSSPFSDAFMFAKDILTNPLSQLFTSIVRHGYVPKLLRDCILQLIPKPGKDPTCSDNYGPIALAPTLSKVLEWCILLIYGDSFSTSPLQFGFKSGMSADMCTGLIKNVISRYCFNGSNVFGCFLDASKAFDRVSHLKLFSKLLEKNLPPTIIRLLFSWYRDQKSSVLWNKTLSENLSVSNGVRQGGVLSPILFIVYIDELLTRLESHAVGCYWSHYFVGALGYADNIVLLAPSASALRMMLNTCCQFAINYNLIFNPGKTQLVRFSLPCSSPNSSTSPTFLFAGQTLNLADRAYHLGHILRSDLSDTDDILRVQTDMCCRANCLLCR